jgi:hypothetical protein
MDPEEYRKKLERDIIAIIVERLQSGDMDVDRAKAIAGLILDKLHPPLSLEEIYKIAPTLDDHYTELTKAVLPVLKEQDEKIKNIVSAQVHQLLKSGKIDEALSTVRQALAGSENPPATV